MTSIPRPPDDPQSPRPCDLCIPLSLYDPQIHILNGVYATEEECLAACTCEEPNDDCPDGSVSNLQISGRVALSSGGEVYLDNEIFFGYSDGTIRPTSWICHRLGIVVNFWVPDSSDNWPGARWVLTDDGVTHADYADIPPGDWQQRSPRSAPRPWDVAWTGLAVSKVCPAASSSSVSGQSSSSRSNSSSNSSASGQSSSSVSGQSSSSVSGQSSSSLSSLQNSSDVQIGASPVCADNAANIKITGLVEAQPGVGYYFNNEIFTPVGNAAAGLWPPVGDSAWESSISNFVIRFNDSAFQGGRWELFRRGSGHIALKAELAGADPETSRPWDFSWLNLSLIRVCPVASSSSSLRSSSSVQSSSSAACPDTAANLQITGDVEVSAGIWENFNNEIFTPVGNAAAGLWPPVGDRAWTSSSGNFYIRFNDSAFQGGRWELIAFDRISHKAELNGADPETSRPWNVTFVHAPTGSAPDPSETLTVNRVCPQT